MRHADSPFPYAVVDQNILRTQRLVDAVEMCRKEDLRLLIVEGAGFELSKSLRDGVDPFRTWKKSLRIIAQKPETIVVGRRLADLRYEEVRTGRPTEDIADVGLTEWFRELLTELSRGDDEGLRSLIDRRARPAMARSFAEMSSPEDFKQEILNARNAMRKILSAVELKDARNDPRGFVPYFFSTKVGVRLVAEQVGASALLHGCGIGTADRLSREPSATAGFITAVLACSLQWLAAGGLEGASPKKISNDFHDLEYAVLGGLSHSLQTNDKKLATVEAAVREGFRARKWSPHLPLLSGRVAGAVGSGSDRMPQNQ